MPDKRSKHAEYLKACNLVERGTAVKEACARSGLSESTYYRYKQRAQTLTIVDKDWFGLGRSWDCEIFEDLSRATTDRLRKDVASILRTIFTRPPRPRRTKIRKDLASLNKVLRRLGRVYGTLSEDSLKELGELHLSSNETLTFDASIRATIDVHQELSEYLEAYNLDLAETGLSKGGRHTDNRVPRAVTALAAIYARHFGQEPNHTIDPDTGVPNSRFNRFVEDAFAHFLPELELEHSTVLREAMRQATAKTDWFKDPKEPV